MVRAVDNHRALQTLTKIFLRIITSLILVGLSACGGSGDDSSLASTNVATTKIHLNTNGSGNSETSASISLESSVSSSIDYEGDNDCYSVEFVPAENYTLDTLSSTSQGGELMDSFLEAYDDLGELRIINYRCAVTDNTDASHIKDTYYKQGSYGYV